MKKYRLKKWGLPFALLAMMVLLISGCQSVGGFDINKALVQSMDPVSGESKQTLSFELVPAEGQVQPEAQELIDIVNSLSLTIDSAKVQDPSTMSLKGSVQFREDKFPFHMAMDERGIAFHVEGAKQPLYISTETAELTGMDLTGVAENQELIQGFTKQAAEFILKHLSNPKTLSVKQTTGKVFEESLNLTQLHTEIRGDELLSMLKPFLTSVAKDEQGLKTLIGAFYDVYYPIMQAAYSYDDYYEDYDYEDYDYSQEDYLDDAAWDDSSAFGFDLNTVVQSKPVMVATLTATVQEAINTLLTDYDENMKKLLEDSPELAVIFGKDTVLKLDVYFDSKLQMRKQQLELTIALPGNEDLPLQAVTIKSDSELRNAGGQVTIDSVDLTSGVFDITDGALTPGKTLRNFEPDSAIYKLLKNDLELTRKSAYIDPDNSYYGVVVKKNTSMVPLRYLSEQLDAEVKWDSNSNSILIIDDLTGQEIKVTSGSKHASIGGKAVVLPQPVFANEYGVTYVPLRFMAEALGATVTVESDGWIFVERP